MLKKKFFFVVKGTGKRKDSGRNFSCRFQPAVAILILAALLLGWLLFYFFSVTGNGNPLAGNLSDFFFRIRYALKGRELVNPYIIHLDLNNTAMHQLALPPWDRSVYARLINILSETEARALFPDFLFAEPVNLPDDAGGDIRLIKAVNRAGNVYFPLALLPQLTDSLLVDSERADERGTIPANLVWYPRIIKAGHPLQAVILDLPFPELAAGAKGLGHTTCDPDPDGSNRYFPLVYRYRDGYIPCMALRMVCDYLLVQPQQVEITFGSRICLKNAVFPSGLQKDIKIPVDDRGRLLMNFAGPWGKVFTHYAADRVLAAEHDPEVRLSLRNGIDDFLIFIADTSSRSAKFFPGPFETAYPSINLHSSLANMILTENFLKTTGLAGKLLLLAVLSLLLYLAAVLFRVPGFSLAVLTVWLLLAGASLLGFCYLGLLPWFVEPSAGLLLAYLAIIILKFIIKEKEIIRYRMRLEASEQIEILNRELAEKNRQLQELDSFKTRFFQNITHEFRTPLTLILGPLTAILDRYREHLPEFIYAELTVVLRNARRLLDLIDQLLELARIDNTTVHAAFRKLGFHSCLEEWMAPFRLMAGKRGIGFQYTIEDKTVSLYLDPQKMEKVVHNLLSNALKFTPPGGSITVNCTRPFHPENLPAATKQQGIDTVVELQIRDTGCGIAAAELPRIFERFYRSAEPGTMETRGTGIGLAIVKEFVKLHFGEIHVESEPGQGSCFTLRLPCGTGHLPPEDLLPDDTTHRQLPDAGETGLSPDQAGDKPPTSAADSFYGQELPAVKYGKILIVEDNPEMALFIKGILDELYYTFLAENGTTGLQKAREIEPALLITDWLMPGMDGVQLIQAVKAEPGLAAVPIILITARAGQDLKQLPLTALPDDYLSKPFTPDELKTRVRNLLTLSRQQQQLLAIHREQLLRVPVKQPQSQAADLKYPHLPVFIVDDNEEVLETYRFALNSLGITHLLLHSDSRTVSEVLATQKVAMVLLDLSMPFVTGQDLLTAIHETEPGLPVIIITGMKTIESAVLCMRLGAFDYLVKPVDLNQLNHTIERALEFSRLQAEVSSLKKKMITRELQQPEEFTGIITNSEKMKAIFLYMEAIAGSPRPVLITGESGVGKELIARVLHSLSGRTGQFVSVNIAGLDSTLFADTLFGHTRGAYTGADTGRRGLIEQAEQGTLFLDEIGDLEPASQVKLLRMLQEREYFPLGSDTARSCNVRVIVATNADLLEKQQQGKFRKDLYYRLLTHPIEVPPLRERLGDDLVLLVDYFLEEAAGALGKRKPAVPPELTELLLTYSFPGNVRELQSMIFDAVSRHSSRMLSLGYFKDYLNKFRTVEEPLLIHHPRIAQITYGSRLPTLEEVEDFFIGEALKKASGKISIAAQLLGVARSTISRRLKKKQ